MVETAEKLNKSLKFLNSSYCLYQVELEGLTGKIKFDQQGLRTEFTLQIVELKKHGLENVK